MSKDYSEKIAQLEQVAVQHRNDPMGAKARADLDRLLREIADEKAEDRHREAMGESQKAEDRHREAMGESRRATWWAGWATVIAGVGAIAAIVGLLLPFVMKQSVQRESQPAPKPDHSAISSTQPKPSAPATEPNPKPVAPSQDKKAKALQMPQKE